MHFPRITTFRMLAACAVIVIAGTLAYAFMNASDTDVTTWRKSWQNVESEYRASKAEPELIIPDGASLYRNERHNFKLAYPAELSVSEQEGAGTLTISFSNTDSSRAFQVFITPYVGWFITEDRIRMDIPSGRIEDPIEVLVDGAQGTIFFSEDPQAGRLREVWFIHGDYLYEVTSYHLLDEWLSHIMTTWRFLREPEHTIISEQPSP